MFAKDAAVQIAVIACLVGLARSGNLQNSALSYGIGDAGYPGYAGAFPGYASGYPGYAGAYQGYAAGYPGSISGYPGTAAGYPGYGSNLGLNSVVATSYVNFNKYTAPKSYNTAYNSASGSYPGMNGGVLNNLPYAGLNGAGYNGLPYSGLNGAGLNLPYSGAASLNGVGLNGLYGGLRGSDGLYDGVSNGGYGNYGYGSYGNGGYGNGGYGAYGANNAW